MLNKEFFSLSSGEPDVRLTINEENRVVKAEIKVDSLKRYKILNSFPDKMLDWKETAPHVLLLKSLASFQEYTLTAEEKIDTDKKFNARQLAQDLKNLCHFTAPLYSLVNHSSLDSPQHPAHFSFRNFKEQSLEKVKNYDDTRLKIAFLKDQLEKYKANVDSFLENDKKCEGIKHFKSYHLKKTEKFIAQLKEFEEKGLSKDQLQKLFSNQTQRDHESIPALGEFLRSQARVLTADALNAIDEISGARIDQLFSFRAHPLRKELIKAKSYLEKQSSTYAIRYMNTGAPLPAGQHSLLENCIDGEAAYTKRWMNLTPYVSSMSSAEDLNTLDKILSVYMMDKNIQSSSDTTVSKEVGFSSTSISKKILLKKEHSKPYKMLNGDYGALGILAIIFLGLPAIVMIGISILTIACLAMVIDIIPFLIRAALLIACSPVLLVAVVVDFILQIPSFFSIEFEMDFSLLLILSNKKAWTDAINQFCRKISCVRLFKQFLLNQHKYYFSIEPSHEATLSYSEKSETEESFQEFPNPPSKASKNLSHSKEEILDRIKYNQAEGLLNTVATKIFSFYKVAEFLYKKIKQLVYAARELRKVIGLSWEIFKHFFQGKAKRIQKKQRKAIVVAISKKIGQRYEEIRQSFIEALEKIHSERATTEVTTSKGLISNIQWPPLAPWYSKKSENPIDFFSEIGILAIGTVDDAFQENPAISTVMFAASMGCFGALLFPSLASIIPAQFVQGLQIVPQYIAKAFMGKALEPGLSTVLTNIFAGFLQWQLLTYGSIGVLDTLHGDWKWIVKIFEHPEEITFGAAAFIGLGYAIGLIPNLPINPSILSNTYDNSFINAVTKYLNTISNTFCGLINVIAAESREVVTYGILGANSLELAFIGLKTSLLLSTLATGSQEVSIQPIQLDAEKLLKEGQAFSAKFKLASAEQKIKIIADLLKQYGINDTHSKLAENISQSFSNLDINITQDGLEFEKNKSEKLLKKPLSIQENFARKREKVYQLLRLVEDLETLQLPIDDLKEASISQASGYQSKARAELMYDQLFFALKDYNQSARSLGLFHEQINGKEVLHAFYNKHCYAGSNGWHKILFGILLFPMTWIWRGLKYLIGTPSMRHQVKKSFCKDFSMLFQLIPDVIAPMLRSLLKAILYSVRMFLGTPLLPLILLTCGVILVVSIIALLGVMPKIIHAFINGIRAHHAKAFSETMKNYFVLIKQITDKIWDTLLCNFVVNGFLKGLSLIGGHTGTGSPHRLNILKKIGAASLYQRLTSVADASYEHLGHSVSHLTEHIKNNPTQQMIEKLNQTIEEEKQAKTEEPVVGKVQTEASIKTSKTIGNALEVLAKYQEESEKSWQPRSAERAGQLEQVSYGLLFSPKNVKTQLEEESAKLKNRHPHSRLAKNLSEFSTQLPQAV